MRRYVLLVFFVFPACNPFSSGNAGLGEPCTDDSDCVSGLICQEAYCEKPGELDCEAADCTQPGKPSQGQDADEDAWGECCDCDDNDPHVKPTAEEIPYNDKDDDCNPYTLDRDLDSDGHDDSEHGGDDCDDNNPQVNPDETEICNGLDDDCDGQTDENIEARECPLQQGVCAGAMQECDGVSAWSQCDYGPDYTDGVDEACDQVDNDCDGQTDEDASVIMLAETGEQAIDGIDNNCNGLIDEKGGIMVPVHQVQGSWIDAYEMTVYENSDCSGTRYGESSDDYPEGFPADGQNTSVTLYACSVPGIVPSGHISRYRAQLACAAQGKRLCTEEEFVNACSSAISQFPYEGVVFDPGSCNDPLGGEGHAAPTGSYPACTARGDTFDMSGNLAEWIAKNVPGQDPPVGFVASWSYSNHVCNDYGTTCLDTSNPDDEERDILKRVLSCPIQNESYLKYPIASAREDFGGRCCMDGT